MVTNQVYAVAGAKGGVGKTTTSINLGAALATAGDYSTVVVELDLAMANLVDFVDVDVTESATLHDVLAGEADVEAAVYETGCELDVVPSGTTLTDYAATDLDKLPAVVETLRWHYDVVLLDTPAGLSEETVRPLELADDALLVSTPRVASVRNTRNTKEVAVRTDTAIRGLVLTKSGTGSSPGAERIAGFLDVELLGHVPEDDAVPYSQDRGAPVVENLPNSGAATAYRKIAEQLIERPSAEASSDSTTDNPGVETTESTPLNLGRAATVEDDGSVALTDESEDTDQPRVTAARDTGGPAPSAGAEPLAADAEDGARDEEATVQTPVADGASDDQSAPETGGTDADGQSLGSQIRSLLGF